MNRRHTALQLACLFAFTSAPVLAAPASAPAQPRCSGAAARPAQLALNMGKSTMMRLPEPVLHRSVGNPDVVQAMLVGPDTLYIAGVDVGTTNMIIQGKSGACSVIDVTVSMDPAALRATLAAVLPDEKDIVVTAAADTIVLSGNVLDATAVVRAGELAAAYVRRPVRALQPGKEEGAGAAPAASATGGVRVINMLGVSAPQQVLLEVKIAEVSKTLLQKLEGGRSSTFRPAAGQRRCWPIS
jgi:pilus assembly protein CpaC